jgi:hypothetical protein
VVADDEVWRVAGLLEPAEKPVHELGPVRVEEIPAGADACDLVDEPDPQVADPLDGEPLVVEAGEHPAPTGLERATNGRVVGEEARRVARAEQDAPAGGGELAQPLAVLRDVPVMVEVKSNRLRAGALERVIAEHLDVHPGPTCVASFNPVVLRWFRRNRPAMVRVLTATSENLNGFAAALLRRFADLRDLPSVAPAAVSYDVLGLPRPAVDAWREEGGVVVTWTVVDEATWEVARRNADNIIFEHIRPELPDTPDATSTRGDRA